MIEKKWTVMIQADGKHGYFERDSDGHGGGLWIENGVLTDYDGVFALPTEVAATLEEMGIKVNEEFKA